MNHSNYYFNDLDNKVYTTEQIQKMTSEEKKHIHLISQDNGKIIDGKFVKKRKTNAEKIQESIDIVDNNKTHANSYHYYVDEGIKIANEMANNSHYYEKFNNISSIVEFIYNQIEQLHKEKSFIDYNKEHIFSELYSYISQKICENNSSFINLFCNKENMREAFKKSQSKVEINRNKNTKKIKVAPKTLAIILSIAITITAGYVLYKRTTTLNSVDKALTLMTYSDYDTEMIDEYYTSGKVTNSIYQNSYRTYDNSGFWIKNSDAAKDDMKVPEYALLSKIMQDYENVAPYYDNLDQIIKELNHSSMYDPESPAYKYTHGCTDFNEFLIKNGFFTYDPQTKELKGDINAFKHYVKEFNLKNADLFIDNANEHMEDLKHGR